MNSSIAGVRQNLKLLVDRGKVSANANSGRDDQLGRDARRRRLRLALRASASPRTGGSSTSTGRRSTRRTSAELLQRAGAVEGMQMDINPAWMKFDYYQAGSHPSDPTPVPLLPTQQPSPYSYYTPSTRDFTAVYAR